VLLENKRIFIVEDNIQNRIVFTMSLKLHGAQVEFDRWGQHTRTRLQAFRQVDLIILDLMLPGGISGYDIFDEIRSLPEYAAVPIVAVSASDPSLALPKTQAKGFAGFIAKPIDVDLFPKQLARVIAGQPVWHAGERYTGMEYDS
jgi:CheY-like chemotaxis protein